VTYSWRNTFIVHVFNLTNVELLLFIKSQFTKIAENVLRVNQSTHGHSRSWNVAPFKSPRAVVNGLTGTKCVGEVAVHFQLTLNKLGVLSVLTDKHLRLEVNTLLGRAQKSNVSRHTLIWTISLVVVSGNSVSCSSVLGTAFIPLGIVIYSLYNEVNVIWYTKIQDFQLRYICSFFDAKPAHLRSNLLLTYSSLHLTLSNFVLTYI